MWRAAVGKDVKLQFEQEREEVADDWETDADFVNDVAEKDSRWGALTVGQSGHQGSLSLDALRRDVVANDAVLKQRQLETAPKASEGYGGRFGVQNDRRDQCAEGWDYKSETLKHASQQDYSRGFGGKFGVQEDRRDKSALGWEHRDNLAQHESQKDYAVGFGGKYGVQKDRQDKSAVGWDYKEKLQSHESQKDYAKGFGGKFGIEGDKQDKNAVGWDYKEKVPLHASQKDFSKGFGGKYGVENRRDEAAVGFDYHEKLAKHESQLAHNKNDGLNGGFPAESKSSERQSQISTLDCQANVVAKQSRSKVEIERGHASSLKSKFEQLTMKNPETERKKAEELREQRRFATKREQENCERQKDGDEHPAREVDAAEEDFFVVTKSPTSPTVVSPTKIAHDLLGRVVPHPEHLQHHSTVQIMDKEQNSSLQPSALTLDEDDWSTGDCEENTMPQGLLENKSLEEAVNTESNVLAEQRMNRLSGGGSVKITESRLEGKGREEAHHPLSPPAHPMADTGVRAVALYDYQAAAADEISFEPDDIISNIEKIDPGWWRGQCRGTYGLFPANYVELLPS